MKSILCFGDSNTYGVNPENSERFPREERWTGILQNLLGNQYYVIEEGYNGRTTVFADESDDYRSAIKTVFPIMKTHSPVDVVVLMLGTNDFKVQFSATPKASANGLSKIVCSIKNYCITEQFPEPKIILVSPIRIGTGVEESQYWEYNKHSCKCVAELAEPYREISVLHKITFVDASLYAKAGHDCLHMTMQSHKIFAKVLQTEIISLFK